MAGSGGLEITLALSGDVLAASTEILSPAIRSKVPVMAIESKRFSTHTPLKEVQAGYDDVLTLILNTISDGVWVCDGAGKVLIINRASEDLNQIHASDCIGRHMADVVAKGLIDRSVTLEVLKKRRQVSMMQHAKATDKHLLVTGTPTFDATGEICLVVVNERDITQLNATKLALEKARQMGQKFKDEVTALNLLELASNEIVTDSPKIREILRTGFKLATQEVSNILLLAESGAGKGVVAKFIHQNSPRRKESLIHINCAALPESLLEAELFGYESGAFTGASEKGKVGLFELADKGTLFLDEIGDMPLSIQSKLLTYLDNNQILRLGGVQPIKINCTVIAATNKDLLDLVELKQFRLDLYYRLSAFTLHIPPLRERKEDILALTQHFLKRYNEGYGVKKRISSAAFERLQNYPFPGNVRELKNIIKLAVVLSEGEKIDEQILGSLGARNRNMKYNSIRSATHASETLDDQLAACEKNILVDALHRHKTTRRMATFLGTSQSSIVRKLKKYGLKLKSK